MNELVTMIASKANLSEETAGTVVETILEFVREKAPAPIAGQIESLLSGEGIGSALTDAMPESAGGLVSKLSGMFAKK